MLPDFPGIPRVFCDPEHRDWLYVRLLVHVHDLQHTCILRCESDAVWAAVRLARHQVQGAGEAVWAEGIVFQVNPLNGMG